MEFVVDFTVVSCPNVYSIPLVLGFHHVMHLVLPDDREDEADEPEDEVEPVVARESHSLSIGKLGKQFSLAQAFWLNH